MPPQAAENAGSGGLKEVSVDQAETFRSFFKTYNTMSELCFNQCVWDFGTQDVRNREERCVMRCVQQYMDSTKEIGRCFSQEHPLTNAAGVGEIQP